MGSTQRTHTRTNKIFFERGFWDAFFNYNNYSLWQYCCGGVQNIKISIYLKKQKKMKILTKLKIFLECFTLEKFEKCLSYIFVVATTIVVCNSMWFIIWLTYHICKWILS